MFCYLWTSIDENGYRYLAIYFTSSWRDWVDAWCVSDSGLFMRYWTYLYTSQWRHNGHDGVSNHQPHHCLLNSLFGCRAKKTSKLRVTGLCAGNSPGTGEFPTQMASNAENVCIWWRHHASGAFASLLHGDMVQSGYSERVALNVTQTHPFVVKYYRKGLTRRLVWSLFQDNASHHMRACHVRCVFVDTGT